VLKSEIWIETGRRQSAQLPLFRSPLANPKSCHTLTRHEDLQFNIPGGIQLKIVTPARRAC
jgi:hypothetical protein